MIKANINRLRIYFQKENDLPKEKKINQILLSIVILMQFLGFVFLLNALILTSNSLYLANLGWFIFFIIAFVFFLIFGWFLNFIIYSNFKDSEDIWRSCIDQQQFEKIKKANKINFIIYLFTPIYFLYINKKVKPN